MGKEEERHKEKIGEETEGEEKRGRGELGKGFWIEAKEMIQSGFLATEINLVYLGRNIVYLQVGLEGFARNRGQLFTARHQAKQNWSYVNSDATISRHGP